MGDFELDYDNYDVPREELEDLPVINADELTLSDEQNTIIDAIEANNNVIVDAVAGSGKTTLVLGLAKKLAGKYILQITYNAALKEEVRKKSQTLENLEVHSYHSLAVKYYDSSAYTDQTMTTVVNENKPLKKIPHFDIIVLDETQDMMILYFQLVKKFIKDTFDPILLVMGDHNQAIYDFKGADCRFLTQADKIWEREFLRLTLNTSYRLTNQISDFVSKVVDRPINTIRDGPNIKYVHGHLYSKEVKSKYTAVEKQAYMADLEFNDSNHLVSIVICEILALLKIKNNDGSLKYNPGDIFILTPSIKNADHFTREIENYLVNRHKIPCYAPSNDSDSKISEIVTRNKIVFTTLNTSKGLERKIVFVCHFDNSYYERYAQDIPLENRSIMRNIHYVALTRSSEILYLLHISEIGKMKIAILPCIKAEHLLELEFKNSKPTKFVSDKKGKKIVNNVAVCDIVSFINNKYLEDLNGLIKYDQTAPINIILMPSIEKFEDNHEDLFALIGIAVPAVWEFTKNKNCTILDEVNQIINDPLISDAICNFDIKAGKICIKDLKLMIIVANIYSYIRTGFIFKLEQITDYSWFTDRIITECVDLFNRIVKHIDKFEVPAEICIKDFYIGAQMITKIYISGRIDGVCEKTKTLWEFKCTASLQMEHVLQLIVYAFMWENMHEMGPDGIIRRKTIVYNDKGILVSDGIDIQNSRKITDYTYKLYNCKTGETFTLIYNDDDINEIMQILCENKFYKGVADDEKFVKDCLRASDPLTKLTLKKLKEMCKELNLPSAGRTKDELVEMINKPDADYTRSVNYASMTVDELKVICEEMGLKKYKSKNKGDLIEMIKNPPPIVEEVVVVLPFNFINETEGYCKVCDPDNAKLLKYSSFKGHMTSKGHIKKLETI